MKFIFFLLFVFLFSINSQLEAGGNPLGKGYRQDSNPLGKVFSKSQIQYPLPKALLILVFIGADVGFRLVHPLPKLIWKAITQLVFNW